MLGMICVGILVLTIVGFLVLLKIATLKLEVMRECVLAASVMVIKEHSRLWMTGDSAKQTCAVLDGVAEELTDALSVLTPGGLVDYHRKYKGGLPRVEVTRHDVS